MRALSPLPARPSALRLRSRTALGATTAALLLVLGAAMVPEVAHRRAVARDERRIADALRMAAALEAFHADRGRYPAPQRNSLYGGWDVSHDGAFVRELLDGGYLPAQVQDPLDDNEHHYRYYLYDAGSYGCAGARPFWVLGIRRFETAEGAAAAPRGFACPERDWSTTFAWVTSGAGRSE